MTRTFMLGAVGEECQGSTVMPGKLLGIDCGEKCCVWSDACDLMDCLVNSTITDMLSGVMVNKNSVFRFFMTRALESLLFKISNSGSIFPELPDPRLIIQSIHSCFNYLRWQGGLDSTCHPSCFLFGLWFNVVSRYWHVKVANLFSFR